MSKIYNLCEAMRMEVMELPYASNVLGFAERVDNGYLPGRDTEVGKKIGNAIRGSGKFYSMIPGAMLIPETINRSYSVDLLLSDIKENPRHSLKLVQTAEALLAAEQLRRLTRILKVIEPVSSTISEIARKGAQLANADGLRPVEKLTRAAYAVVMQETRERKPKFVDHLTLARVFRLHGKLGRAIWHGLAAGKLADTELKESGYSEDTTDFFDQFERNVTRMLWRSGMRLFGNIFDETDLDYDGCPTDLDDKYKWQLRKGAALTVMSGAFHDMGDHAQAEEYARRALSECDFTCAKEVLATIARPDGGFLDRIAERAETMDGIKALDRTYYHGRWNGAIRISAGVGEIEIEKIRSLFS